MEYSVLPTPRVPNLQGKVALVTGASTGIGATVARGFGAQGMKVAVHYNRSQAQANDVAAAIREAGGEAVVLQADVRDSAAIRRAVQATLDAFGRIDVLVNNAGSLVQRAPVAELTDELFDEVLHINARSMLAFVRRVVPAMN